LVVDASVIVKWALPDSEAEEEALAVLAAVESGEASVLQESPEVERPIRRAGS
jgi:predicted nucleic acid-binding protein